MNPLNEAIAAAEEPTLPSPAELRELLRYDEVSGNLYWRARGPDHIRASTAAERAWRARQWNGRLAGNQIVNRDFYGYFTVTIHNKQYKAHRVIWAMVHGEWPAEVIDHINGDPGDNRLSNLRAVPRTLNQRNMKKLSTNRSGVTGVH